jgi:hypothetical protein
MKGLSLERMLKSRDLSKKLTPCRLQIVVSNAEVRLWSKDYPSNLTRDQKFSSRKLCKSQSYTRKLKLKVARKDCRSVVRKAAARRL